MLKVCADLTDIEYDILKKIPFVEGKNGEKLRNLLRYYISTMPELKSSEYALERIEKKKEIEEIVAEVENEYESTDDPVEKWGDDKTGKLTGELVEINVLVKADENQFMPAYKFKSLFKMLIHDIATESRDMDEYTAAILAAIQLLMEFGGGSLSKETIRDAAILINEKWMYAYAGAMKKAREFMKTKKLFFSEVEIAESFSTI
ncbi:MAG TPA: hypothetical protein VIO58_08965 [Candidatus Methanoperedens sp.]